MFDGFATTTSSSSTWLSWHWWLQLWCYVACTPEDDLDLNVDRKVVAVALQDLLPDQAAQGDRGAQGGTERPEEEEEGDSTEALHRKIGIDVCYGGDWQL